MSQYTELKAQIAKLQEQAEEARRAELEAVLVDIRRKIVELTVVHVGASGAERSFPVLEALLTCPGREGEIVSNTRRRFRAFEFSTGRVV